MTILKWVWGLILLGVLVAVIQLADPPKDSPVEQFQRLPDVNLRKIAEAEQSAGQPDTALLLLDYVIENDLPDKAQAVALRQQYLPRIVADPTPVGRVKAIGATSLSLAGNSFASLAGSSVADAALYGDIAEAARQGAFEDNRDDFINGLNSIGSLATVFPPAGGAITLAKAAKRAGAIDETLSKQLRQTLSLIQPDPKSSLSLEKFRENFMPILELSRKCRTWGEFQTILRQADSADQIKVLTKMISVSPEAPRRLSQVLAVAAQEGKPAESACLDHVMRQGPKGIDALYAATYKGIAGLKFATEYPSMTPNNLRRVTAPQGTGLNWAQDQYRLIRYQHGPVVSAMKYLAIAILCGMLVLVVVPGKYLEKLIAKPGNSTGVPGAGPIHYLMLALAVGAVLSGMAYLFSMVVRPTIEPASQTATEAGASTGLSKGDSAALSGTVVLLSLATHAVIWFFVRSKIRSVEDDEESDAALRLKRLENLDIFLDLPLFTGLALTVFAFILITLDAGMSRHFAYTSTVVGILSAVSLRIRYLYPLKERLIQAQ